MTTADQWLRSAPAHWNRGRLKNLIATATNGTWGSEPIGKGSDVHCIRAADFDRASRRADLTNAPLRYVDPSSLRQHLLRPGDLLLEKSGGGERQPVGMAVLFTGTNKAVCSNFCARIKPSPNVDPRYLTYAFTAAYGQGLTQSAIKQTTGIQNLDTGAFFASRWAYPEKEEQRHIADFLDAETTRIDNLVAALQRELDLLAERRAAGLAAAVSGRTHTDRRNSTLAWLESVPTAWQEVRVGLLARMGSGHTPSRSHPEWWTDCYIPWITTGEVKQVRDDRIEDLYQTREKISALGLANSAAELHPKGTVFLCRTASAGYSGVMGLDMATSQDFVTWTCGPRLLPHFLLWCLRAMRPDLLGRLAMGSTHKTIYVPDLQMLRIPLPPLKEQEQILHAIRCQNARIDTLTDKVRRQQELLRERRQALITAAVTGQFHVSTASGRNVTEGVAV
ncbi:restriction endonuclease subunit S [Streptomyces sp. WAC 00631]|uniref:restriction endonuclease subunit S n=1 Tax=Streptomyces sp. WAC 00631 TaxID=2203201 RepID=UPI000F7ACCD7|nr:restriction endonuclease subunit S [Streptomyces sp. WAC 00631]MCC5036322.1 restriction endonuclease subunit S [Streptomyces sp. WAC 00631]